MALTLELASPAFNHTRSLRQAILNVNEVGDGRIVFVNISLPIVITNALPPITARVTIIGPGTNFPTFSPTPTLQISTQAVVRVLRMTFDLLTLINSGSLHIADSRIGSCTMTNNGMLVMIRCPQWGESATMKLAGTGSANIGGMHFRGVDLDSGELALTDCVISGRTIRGTNAASTCYFDPLNGDPLRNWIVCRGEMATAAKGGGVYLRTGILSMTDVMISDNHVRGGNGGVAGTQVLAPEGGLGGGLYMESGSLRMTNCTVANNSGIGGYGGFRFRGYYVGGAIGVGGIYVSRGTAVLVNCTISRNSGTGGDGNVIAGGSAVGGLYADFSAEDIRIINCTATENTASAGIGYWDGFFEHPGIIGFGAGGVWSNGRVRMVNTIMANNLGSMSPPAGSAVLIPNDGIGDIVSLGHNFFGTTNPLVNTSFVDHFRTNYLTGFTNTDVIGLNALLGPLQDNGGPVFTHALLAGSPAIDAGSNSGLAFDARGQPRTIDNPAVPNAFGGDGTDIGPLEVNHILTGTEVRKAGNDVRVRFSSVSDKIYGVEYRPEVGGGLWTELPGTIAGTGGFATYTDVNAASHPRRFYRIFERAP